MGRTLLLLVSYLRWMCLADFSKRVPRSAKSVADFPQSVADFIRSF